VSHAESVRAFRLYGLVVRLPLLSTPPRGDCSYGRLLACCVSQTRTCTSLVVRAFARTWNGPSGLFSEETP